MNPFFYCQTIVSALLSKRQSAQCSPQLLLMFFSFFFFFFFFLAFPGVDLGSFSRYPRCSLPDLNEIGKNLGRASRTSSALNHPCPVLELVFLTPNGDPPNFPPFLSFPCQKTKPTIFHHGGLAIAAFLPSTFPTDGPRTSPPPSLVFFLQAVHERYENPSNLFPPRVPVRLLVSVNCCQRPSPSSAASTNWTLPFSR